MFRKFRILVWLLILLAVAWVSWRSDVRLTSWEQPVHVAVYPIDADSSAETAQFINDLYQERNKESFAGIERWLADEARRYGVDRAEPVVFWLGDQVREKPPEPPETSGIFSAISWSLRLRWWAYWHDTLESTRRVKPQVRLFVLFHNADRNTSLPHSIGLQRGKVGVIHVFASQKQRQQNAVIIAHELLHTYGATDKYDLSTLQPLYPIGYAEPERKPLLPQVKAEIMGGRIPLTEQQSRIPDRLADTRIGPATAVEIGLLPVPDTP